MLAMSFTVSVIRSMIDLSLSITASSKSVAGLTGLQATGSMAETSLRELKPFEAVQFFLNALLQVLSSLLAGPDPTPFLHQQFPVLAVGLEVERGDNPVTGQH